jgi:hypothetical protein
MINVAEDIHSFTTFKRNSSDLRGHMKKTGRPLVLPINGKAEAVVPDPIVHQQVAEHLDAIARIRRGLAQAKRGEGQTVDEVFDELEREPSDPLRPAKAKQPTRLASVESAKTPPRRGDSR